MFIHLVKNRIKILIRDKELMFWTFLFPILLGTFFYMAFSNLTAMENYKSIPVAVINTTQYQEDTYFSNTLQTVSSGEDKLFDLQILTLEEATQKLENKEIVGYISDNDWIVREEGLEQTIVKTFLDQYQQKKSMIETVAMTNQGKIDPSLIQDLVTNTEYIRKTNYGRENPDSSVNYFFTLIAMACLYGAYWGVKEIRDIQANQASRAVRVNIAPVHKLKTVLYNLAATFIVNFACILVLLAYLIFVLKIDFGVQLGFVILTCLIGVLVGISLGMLIGVLCKKGENTKSAIILAVSMTGSFLAGMMYENMRYIIMTHAPILGYINPVNLLTDAFYTLYYYETFNKFCLDIGILAVMIIVMLIIVYQVIRRQKYESI